MTDDLRKVPALDSSLFALDQPERHLTRSSDGFRKRSTHPTRSHLFDYDDPADAFAITDDFMSAGRISGAECIPIPQLQVGQFKTINGKRLQGNKSQLKYKRELEYLTDIH
jgi:chromosome partitioning protein